MNTTLELIQILDAIDRNGSFEAAAKKLHKVRSALSYNIRKFEERLGIKIFDRNEHKAKFTQAGRLLLDQGRHLINLSHQVEENVKHVATGWEPVIRIAYDEILSIKPIFDLIKRFQIQCPKVNFELYSEVLGGCADALINNRVDIAIGFPAPLPSCSELLFEPLGKTKFVFAVAPNHPLATMKEPLSTEKITQYTVIAVRDSSRQTMLQSSMLLPDQHRITFSSIELKIQALVLGLGVGFLPYNLIKEDIRSGRLIIKQVERSQPTSYVYIGWNKAKTGKANQWFINQIRCKNLLKKLLT